MFIVKPSGKAVSTMDLFINRCDCGEMNVYGFWHQLDEYITRANNSVTLTLPCRQCGACVVQEYMLEHDDEDLIELGYNRIAMGC